MNVSPSALIAHARSDEGRKQLRYVGVSVVFVPVGQILVQILGAVFDGNFTKASIVASAILTVPNFFANRHFVWRVENRENMRTQVLVFWVAAMLGVSLATLLTFVVENALSSGEGAATGAAPLSTRIAVFFAQLAGFGIVWVIRYLVLDRWLFKITHHGEEPTPDDLDEMHGDIPV
jgi:putative flippase GtrA